MRDKSISKLSALIICVLGVAMVGFFWNGVSGQNFFAPKAEAKKKKTIIAGHSRTNLSKVSKKYVKKARKKFRILYGHTSHGSQIITGMENLKGDPGSRYYYSSDGSGKGLKIKEISGDLGQSGNTSWADTTRSELNADRSINMVMWSWCGGVSSNTEEEINTYLSAMNQLEQEYPKVKFIYMTGHLDGTGENGTLHQMNNLIRDYARNNKKILFDFADIESYDPSGNYFLNRGADDNNDYDSGNWATEWCAAHAGDSHCASCECAHSQPLNCNLKARAFWWLMAKLAGGK